MKLTTKYDIWDEVETLLGDIGYIQQIIIQSDRIRYWIRYGSDKYRTLEKKGFYTKDAPDSATFNKSGLFGRNRFAAGSNKAVVITEGELDALSLWQVLRIPVVSVHSSSSARTDCSLERPWLNSFDRIYLAFDGDGPGRDAAQSVAALFDFNKVYELKFPGGNRKDANDYLRNGERDELATLFANAKKYLPSTIISSFNEFDKIIAEEPKSGVKPQQIPVFARQCNSVQILSCYF